jgi:prephenate dehydrogenase
VPYLLSIGLVNAVGGMNDNGAHRLASSGYRGMTRLAASDLRMMGDIVATNGPAILDMLDRCQREIAELRDAIAAGDEAAWQAKMAKAYELKHEA